MQQVLQLKTVSTHHIPQTETSWGWTPPRSEYLMKIDRVDNIAPSTTFQTFGTTPYAVDVVYDVIVVQNKDYLVLGLDVVVVCGGGFVVQ